MCANALVSNDVMTICQDSSISFETHTDVDHVFVSLYCHCFVNTVKYYVLRIDYCVLSIMHYA